MSRREARRSFKCKNRSPNAGLQCGEQTAHQANFSHIGEPKKCAADDTGNSTRRAERPSQSGGPQDSAPRQKRGNDLAQHILFGALTMALDCFSRGSLRGIFQATSTARPDNSEQQRTPSAMNCFLATLALALFASIATAKTLPYDPAVVTLQGTLLSGDGMTPDGKKLKFPAIRLAEPISVPEDEPRDWSAEKGVVLLHLALDEKNMAAFKRLKGKPVKVTGKLFHSDNGNHQTNVLIFPVSITPIE
jgi:hypothetical protein